MNRDTTIMQVAILFIIIAALWVAIFNKQRQQLSADSTQTEQNEVIIENINEWLAWWTVTRWDDTINIWAWVWEWAWTGSDTQDDPTITNSFSERINSARQNTVKQYFAAIANRQYAEACRLLDNGSCASRPWAVENFSREFEKMKNWYEYVNTQDYGITAPSWKWVVCVKYSYRYEDDPNPQLISEVASFYVDKVGEQRKITDRVCEKKYKEWRWNRPCPIKPNARFCVDRIK